MHNLINNRFREHPLGQFVVVVVQAAVGPRICVVDIECAVQFVVDVYAACGLVEHNEVAHRLSGVVGDVGPDAFRVVQLHHIAYPRIEV